MPPAAPAAPAGPSVGERWVTLVTRHPVVTLTVSVVAVVLMALPALGLQGAALATTLVLTGMAFVLLGLVHTMPALRRFVAWSRPDGATLAAMLRLGLPVSLTFAVETGLFLAVSLLMGLLSPASLAAQQVAMSLVSISFMIPLAIAQAANVRVGHRTGAGDRAGARRAGFVAIGLGAAFEAVAAITLACTSNGGSMLGIMWRKAIRSGEAPMVRAASI